MSATGGGSLVDIASLTIEAAGTRIVDGLSLRIAPGESVGIAGHSGSGKTTTALAVLGWLREGTRHIAGTVAVRGHPVLPVAPAWLRGGVVAYVPQDFGPALNPYRRVGAALLDAAGPAARERRPEIVARSLARVGLPTDPEFTRRFPHQLSGGQQQRLALAVALRRDPALLILDEPTTGLDALTKAEILAELRRIHATGLAMLWVSHDLATLAAVVTRLVVIERGLVVEDGPTARVLTRPASAAAAGLIAASPRPAPDPPDPPDSSRPAALAAHRLVAGYQRHDPVLDGIDFAIGRGECLAVLGASGAGKSTLARCLVGLHRPRSGRVELAGVPLAADVRRRTTAQRAAVQLVAQDPAEALHPRQTVRTALIRPLLLLRGLRGASLLDAEVVRLLEAVQLEPDCAGRLPGELSGGERQRIALARALAAAPDVLICDEVTSSLDMATQAAVLALLARMRAELDLAVVLITHDLAVAASAGTRVAVVVDGSVVEEATPATLMTNPASDIGRCLAVTARQPSAGFTSSISEMPRPVVPERS